MKYLMQTNCELEHLNCFTACREPKVSKLVRQKVLKYQPPSRKSPVHKLYSASIQRGTEADTLEKAFPVFGDLPPTFHHVYTSIEYECVSAARHTCLKTGKWSGRHFFCSPVCGKLPSASPQNFTEIHWPWHAAIYTRLYNASPLMKDQRCWWTKLESVSMCPLCACRIIRVERSLQSRPSSLASPQQASTWHTHSEAARTGLIELADVVKCKGQFSKHSIPISTIDNMLCEHQHPLNPSMICTSQTGGIILSPSADSQPTLGLKDTDSHHAWKLLELVVYTRVANFKNWIEKNIT
uniref:Peptidase S1 domain-containing protein n=1 Tax=Cyprinus carpio TaxID=7962 RepID=A0A8C1JH20_CYPCA